MSVQNYNTKAQTKAKNNTRKHRRTLEDAGVKHGGAYEETEQCDEDKREHRDYSHTITRG